MATMTTTRLSSKGQVVIPEEIRQKLNLVPGMRFLVMGEGDEIILKVIAPPSMKDFDALIAQARSQARKAGLRKSDIEEAVRRVRGKR